jgi:L-ascorbate metabolism protein UlaG (beta-lactamase superfamily)
MTEPEALDGADAVLITHEHFDHLDEGRVRAALDASPGLRVWTKPARAYSVHEEVLSEIGKTVVSRLLGDNGPGVGAPYERLSPGDTVRLTGAGSGGTPRRPR